MSRETRTVIKCDFCNAEIKNDLDSSTIVGKDSCRECLVKIHDEVEEEYMRKIKGQVKSRRGGYRNLGDLDT